MRHAATIVSRCGQIPCNVRRSTAALIHLTIYKISDGWRGGVSLRVEDGISCEVDEPRLAVVRCIAAFGPIRVALSSKAIIPLMRICTGNIRWNWLIAKGAELLILPIGINIRRPALECRVRCMG